MRAEDLDLLFPSTDTCEARLDRDYQPCPALGHAQLVCIRHNEPVYAMAFHHWMDPWALLPEAHSAWEDHVSRHRQDVPTELPVHLL